VCLAICLTLSPALAQDASSKANNDSSIELKNVALNSKGELIGRLMSPSGKPKPHVEVKRHSSANIKQIVGTVKTDKDGRFVIRGLHRGSCLLTAQDQSYAFRVWPEKQAPPNAIKTIALITKSIEFRGQQNERFASGNSTWGLSTAQKLTIGVGIAAAIAIPVALSSDDDDDAS